MHIGGMDLSSYLNRRGAVSALADALGVAHTTVMRWRDGTVPADRVAEVARVTGIPAAKLRPDLAATFAVSANAVRVRRHRNEVGA